MDLENADLPAIHLTRRNNLKRIVTNLKKSKRYKNQSEISEVLGYPNPSYLSQLLSTHRVIGDSLARMIESKLGLDSFELDRAPEPGKEAINLSLNSAGFYEFSINGNSFIFIDDVSNYYESENKNMGIPFLKSWITKELNIHIFEKLAVMAVADMNMYPTLKCGDRVLLNTDDLANTKIKKGKMYAYTFNDEIHIGRFFLGGDDSICIKSDNSNKVQFPDIEFDEFNFASHIEIIGMVIWQSGIV